MCAMYSQRIVIYSSHISILILVSKFSLKNKVIDVFTIVAKEDISPDKLNKRKYTMDPGIYFLMKTDEDYTKK